MTLIGISASAHTIAVGSPKITHRVMSFDPCLLRLRLKAFATTFIYIRLINEWSYGLLRGAFWHPSF